jgi:hypothetical protein
LASQVGLISGQSHTQITPHTTGHHACLPPLPTAVLSGSTVTYSCPRGTSWTAFDVVLTASAGPTGCVGTGSGTAAITVTAKPTLNVAATNSPVTICEADGAQTVPVTFEVTANPAIGLSLPPEIIASDGRSCMPAPGNSECLGAANNCMITVTHHRGGCC